jgi:Spy/CpxP family protein refolding chaperone
MKATRSIRIVILLLVIFASGIVTGRLTAPKTSTLVTTAHGGVTTSANAVAQLKRHLNLTPEQEQQFGKLFEGLAVEMSRLPPASQERLDAFRRRVPEMEALLKPEQREALQKYVAETEKRFQRVIRRRGK